MKHDIVFDFSSNKKNLKSTISHSIILFLATKKSFYWHDFFDTKTIAKASQGYSIKFHAWSGLIFQFSHISFSINFAIHNYGTKHLKMLRVWKEASDIFFCLFYFVTSLCFLFLFFGLKTRNFRRCNINVGWVVCIHYTSFSAAAYIWFYLKAAHLYEKSFIHIL